MNKRRILYAFIVSLLISTLHAQQFGATPSNIRWRQINNDTAAIIYPSGLDSIAQRIASIVHAEQRHFSNTIGNNVHKISIVLRNELTYFNGYVSLGPYRSEFYLQPQQNAFELGAQSAADMLAVHEYRHVEQYSNFRKGLSKTAYILFGQNGQALANNAAVPNWFFEGDAVYNETLLTEQGRGRLPYFFNGYKAIFLQKKEYSFIKLRNGSYKDFIPDHYPLGYMLVAYGREKYGDDIWQKITDDAVRFKPLIYPWQGALYKHTGIRYKQFINDAFKYYRQQWKNEKEESVVEWLKSSKHNVVTSYEYPYAAQDNHVIVLKSSYNKTPAFYSIDTYGKETKIATQSITNDNYFSYNNNKIVYTAYKPDIRWGYREYSSIKLVDVVSGKEQNITGHTKYFSPDISHSGNNLVAVSVLPEQQSSVDLLDIKGNKLFSFGNNENLIYSYPKFSADDQCIYVIARRTNGEMSLQKLNLSTKGTETILPFANRILGFPVVHGDTLLYTCTNKGRDEVWAYIEAKKEHYNLATYPTGIYHAILTSGKQLIGSSFTTHGYKLGVFRASWQRINNLSDTLIGLYVTKPFDTAVNTFLSSTADPDNYAISKYSKLAHPFNFHSLQPDYSDPVFSLTLFGENTLSTIQNQLYYVYNSNEGYSQVGYDIVYGGLYVQPYIDASAIFNRNSSIADSAFKTWNELNIAGGLRLPLNFSGGRQYRYLTASVSYHLNEVQYTNESKNKYGNQHVNYMESRLLYTGQLQQAQQQIFPHWAQSFLAQYRTHVGNRTSQQLLLIGSLYLPGFSNTHSIVLNGAFQTRSSLATYLFSNNFPFSRGYNAYDYPQIFKAGINYHIPLLYPDFGIGNIVYVRRIRTALFYDYTQLRGRQNGAGVKYPLKSFGTEVYFDTKWWNQQSITVGLRYSRLLDYKLTRQQPNQWTIILPDSIFN